MALSPESAALVDELDRAHEMTLAETFEEEDERKCAWCGQWGRKEWGTPDRYEHARASAPDFHVPGCEGPLRRAAFARLRREIGMAPRVHSRARLPRGSAVHAVEGDGLALCGVRPLRGQEWEPVAGPLEGESTTCDDCRSRAREWGIEP